MSPFRDIVSVRLGEFAVAREEGRLAALGLGSCVAVILHDAEAKVGGLAHVVLPDASASSDRSNPMKFGDHAVPQLVDEMVKAGASEPRIAAKLIGGACMFSSLIPADAETMGERNVRACREALDVRGIPVVAEDVGARHGRSAVLDVADGSVTVRTVGRGTIRV